MVRLCIFNGKSQVINVISKITSAGLSNRIEPDYSVLNHPGHSLTDRLEGAVARRVIQQALGLRYAAARAVHDMIPCSGPFFFRHGLFPLIPW